MRYSTGSCARAQALKQALGQAAQPSFVHIAKGLRSMAAAGRNLLATLTKPILHKLPIISQYSRANFSYEPRISLKAIALFER
jgi:hypothetical protein